MRITTNMIYNRNINALTSTNERLSTAYEQLMTGERFKTAGEDPSAMGSKMDLTNEIELFRQYNVNSGLLENSLGHEETIVTALNTAMQSATTLIQKSNNSAMSQADREAIASELRGLQQQMFDLMNTKNSQGEFIFGGNKNSIPPFVRDASGQYVFQGDTGQRMIQVSSTVTIAAGDNGLDMFQSVPTRRTATPTSANITVNINQQEQFNNFFNSTYKPSGGNSFSVSTMVGPPSQYQIKDSGGALLQSGNYNTGENIDFNGAIISLSIPVGGATQTFQLDTPKNDNILNGMESFIKDLEDPMITPDQFHTAVADATEHMNNARKKMDTVLGIIGGRMNTLDQVNNSNSSLDIFNKETRAKVSEVDLYEAISTLAKEDAALGASQTAFSKISRLTLFDYIR